MNYTIKIGKIKEGEKEHFEHTMQDDVTETIIKALEQEPKTGHWITERRSELWGDMWATNPKCSACGGKPYFSNTIYTYNFCPYCGVKMERSDKE